MSFSHTVSLEQLISACSRETQLFNSLNPQLTDRPIKIFSLLLFPKNNTQNSFFFSSIFCRFSKTIYMPGGFGIFRSSLCVLFNSILSGKLTLHRSHLTRLFQDRRRLLPTISLEALQLASCCRQCRCMYLAVPSHLHGEIRGFFSVHISLRQILQENIDFLDSASESSSKVVYPCRRHWRVKF